VTEPVRDYLRTSRAPLEQPLAFLRACSQVEKFSLNFLEDGKGGWKDWDKVQAILADYPGLSVVSGGANNLEITSPTANKGRALLALADFLGIDHGQTMACGDSENDLEMLKAAGLSIAMANSEDCLFPWADDVTKSNEEDGVAWAIRRHILAESE
jgi:hydroxymethylpyrimidine pyrophosphatase-like HAD family hydrolase